MGNKGSQLGEEELAQFVAKTHFTREQILLIREQFLVRDKDHTDGLTLPEFKVRGFGLLRNILMRGTGIFCLSRQSQRPRTAGSVVCAV